jgi:hypothetical protein
VTALKTGGMIFCVSFGATLAMACIGIIIQEEQRKRKALDEVIAARMAVRTERGFG